MPSNTENVKLGVCRAIYNGVDLGLTKGGVEVTVTTETHKTEVDQYGKTPINEIIMGRVVTAKVPMAETTLDNMVKIMPGAVLVTDSVDSTKKVVKVPTGTGTSLLGIAQALVLHPVNLPENDPSEDFTIFKAATAGALSFAYKLEDERVFSCEFTGYPDADGNLFAYGDTTASAA